MIKHTIAILALIVLMLQAYELGAVNVHSTAILNSTVMKSTGFVHPPAIPLSQKPSNSANNGAITSQSTLPSPTYVEQIGESFAQNFESLAYNVTATAQSAADGYGPSYILNGLSNTNYWYQMGVGYALGNTGFSFVYEVWNTLPQDVSVFGGNPRFHGTINPGDEVLLNLYFLNGNVVMYAYDWNTGASASTFYSAEGATYFAGTSSNACFSGLMTEQWHTSAYNGTEQPVTYTVQPSSSALTSSKMWADEWVPSNGTVLFSYSVIFTYWNPSQLQYYTTGSNYDAVAASNAYTFITGSYPLTVQTPTPISQTVMQGETVTITSGQIINGTAPYSYQWFVQTPGVSSYTPISGATSSSYAFSTSTSTNTGTYSFVLQVADSPSPMQNAGIQSSRPATVTLNSPGHEVAVTNVTLSKTVFGQGYPGSVTVTIQNQGNFSETFKVTVYSERWPANTTSIASQNVTLSSGNSTNITLTGNTTGLAYGDYTISAYASPVAGEMNTANNNCTGGQITITIPGDVDGDFTVKLKDLVLLTQAYVSKPGDSNWNPNADINGDGKVSLADLVILFNHYGQHYP